MADKEMKELLVGVNELAIILMMQFKDGMQVADFAALYMKYTQDADLKAKLDAAIAGISQVPAEMKSVTLQDGIELAILQASYVPKIIEAMKK